MKNFILTALTVLVSLTTQAQQPGKHVYIPGQGRLDVEQFIKPIDTRIDSFTRSQLFIAARYGCVIPRKQ